MTQSNIRILFSHLHSKAIDAAWTRLHVCHDDSKGARVYDRRRHSSDVNVDT